MMRWLVCPARSMNLTATCSLVSLSMANWTNPDAPLHSIAGRESAGSTAECPHTGVLVATMMVHRKMTRIDSIWEKCNAARHLLRCRSFT